ncbi:MAG TPA: DUF2203 domain-containing protein [Gemmatimonadales bacterium]|nr:DUF2203 domain-containing protein [Gemmatimonadales bacterium]
MIEQFTPESAARTLPLVSRIVADVVALKRAWRAAVHRFDLLQVGVGPAGQESEAATVARREAESLAGQIDACVEELAQVGCRMRDSEVGLVDFPTERDGEPIVLSWQLGETDVGYWLAVDPRDRDRQPIDELLSVPDRS